MDQDRMEVPRDIVRSVRLENIKMRMEQLAAKRVLKGHMQKAKETVGVPSVLGDIIKIRRGRKAVTNVQQANIKICRENGPAKHVVLVHIQTHPAYSDTPGSATCTQCPYGKYQPGTGSTGCLDCAEGTHQHSERQTGCIDCDVGTYTDALLVLMENISLKERLQVVKIAPLENIRTHWDKLAALTVA